MLCQVLLTFNFLFLLNSYGDEKSSIDVITKRVCGPASIEELKESCDQLPRWLLSAQTSEERLSISDEGVVIWHDGTWKGGIWKDGIWKNGIWEYGIWENGTWENGVWENGTWKNGTWINGFWDGGLWKNGTWKGGFWAGGVWKNGTWQGGTWKGQFKNSDFDPKTAN